MRPLPEIPAEVTAWAVHALAPDGELQRVTAIGQGGDRGPWALVVATPHGQVKAVVKVAPVDADERARVATAVTALRLAAEGDVPAPRLLAADLDGEAAGVLLLLTTRLPGRSSVVRQPPPDRLHRLGAVAAAINAVPVDPTPTLPPRRGTLEGYDVRGDRRTASSPLLDRAVEVLAAGAAPVDGQQGLVHGDLWQGNTMWDDDGLTGVIDWDFAGVGPAGIDLGTLRCDVAMLHGGAAAALVLEGWERQAGRPAPDVAWWDVAAGAATPDDLDDWLPNFHAQGRTDLDLATVTERRDRFLREALSALG